jgi:hypothetical protein
MLGKKDVGQERMTRLARENLLGNLIKVSMSTCEHCLKGKSIKNHLEKPLGHLFH